MPTTRLCCSPLILLGCFALSAVDLRAADDRWSSPPAAPGGKIVFRVVTAQDENPTEAGRSAAQSLRKAMGDAPLRAVLISECYEGKAAKEQLLAGLASALPKEVLLGSATYGSFTQSGCTDAESVCLLGIGGDGVGVSAALVTGLGTAKLTVQDHLPQIQSLLDRAGRQLAEKLKRSGGDRLLILFADAHSPKNQPLVEGTQKVLGRQFPITGGCANKNAGQTFVYYNGRAYEDSAVALLVSGDLRLALAGRQAKDNDRVIATARQCAEVTSAAFRGKPQVALGFNCAGRRSKLKDFEHELAAIQQGIGKELPLFGCYCAGEMGPVDDPQKKPGCLSGGSGWHLMFTLLGI